MTNTAVPGFESTSTCANRGRRVAFDSFSLCEWKWWAANVNSFLNFWQYPHQFAYLPPTHHISPRHIAAPYSITTQSPSPTATSKLWSDSSTSALELATGNAIAKSNTNIQRSRMRILSSQNNRVQSTVTSMTIQGRPCLFQLDDPHL